MTTPADNNDGKSEETLRLEALARAEAARNERNASRLARLEAIADSAETTGEHVGDEELTEEMWVDADLPENVRTARAMARAQAEGREEEDRAEDDDTPSRGATNDQAEEERDDEAREAGADDVRITNGEKEYRLTINGKTVWRTLPQIRAAAQKVESADEYLESAVETARTATRPGPSAEEAETGRQRAERVARRKELLRRQAMGDESAIDELAELDESRAAPSEVTPDVLRALDERFDSRVSFRDAVNWFEDEYSPELRHQAMKLYAGRLDAELAERNPRMAPKERLRRVGEQLRKELKETYGVTREGGGPSPKALRKSEVRRPTPAAERRPSEEGEEREESTADVIQGMARARHQPRAVVHGPNGRNRG